WRARKQEFYGVKEVLSPEELTLTNGRVVRLLGVRQNRTTDGEAKAFLERLTRNQKVFFKTDHVARDADGRLCYLYLKNRTFVNARLIKSGLVDVDTSLDYEKRGRFIGYLRTD